MIVNELLIVVNWHMDCKWVVNSCQWIVNGLLMAVNGL